MKDKILEKLSQEEIFQAYFPYEIKTNNRYTNPLREDDTCPGCFFKYLDNTLMFVDFAHNPTHMDCFTFIQKMYDLSFYEVLCKISVDYGLKIHRPSVLFEDKTFYVKPKKPSLFKEEKAESIIKVITKAFEVRDLEYWEQFGITLPTLQHFNVKPVYRTWIDGLFFHEYSNDDPMYRYRSKGKFKIYRPFATKWYKFRTNISGGILDGWEYLPDKGDTLIITKSYKDIMTLYELGYNSISVRAESALISDNAAKLLSARFKNIYIWFDNDNAGNKFSKKMADKYGWNIILFPKDYPKDPSDFVKKYDKLALKNFIKKII